MWKLFNLKWDRRTARNIMLLPIIVFVRIPVVLFLIVIDWIHDWSDVVCDKLPSWKS